MKLTKEEAVKHWVSGFSSIPSEMLRDIMYLYPGESYELTTPELPDGVVPSHGTVWAFKEPLDNEWLEKNIEAMAEAGFRVFKTYYGYWFGIDGGGYNFYDYHWTSLYDARGMHWHSDD